MGGEWAGGALRKQLSHSEVSKGTTVIQWPSTKKKPEVEFSSLSSVKGLMLCKPEQKSSWSSETLTVS